MHDVDIILPNALGLGCALVQVGLKIAYRDTSGSTGYCLCGNKEETDDKQTVLLDDPEVSVQETV